MGNSYFSALPALMPDSAFFVMLIFISVSYNHLDVYKRQLQVCAQKGLVERCDSSIGAASVLMPYAGKYQLSPEEAMVAKIPVLKGETDDATAMSFGFITGISKWSPFHGAAYVSYTHLIRLAGLLVYPA